MRTRSGISSTAIIASLVAVALILLAVVGVFTSGRRPIGPASPHETTTIFISASCTSSRATTNSNSTTTYVRTFVGNLTVVTSVQGFSTNATQICR
jgi:hypothetical membrane protein